MKFLDTNESQINPGILSNLLQSILPNNPLTTVGLVCLAGGIGYYSWNYYKNKKQKLNENVIQNNEDEKKYLNECEEKTTLNSNNLTNELSNISKEKTEFKILDDNNIKKEIEILDDEDEKNYDMLNDVKETINDVKETINDEDEWAIIDLPSYSNNLI